MADMFYTIDNTRAGRLDWHAFSKFMNDYRKKEFKLLNESAGFNAVEADYLKQVFQSADVDKSGQLALCILLLS